MSTSDAPASSAVLMLPASVLLLLLLCSFE
jgi:hypothetical protein